MLETGNFMVQYKFLIVPFLLCFVVAIVFAGEPQGVLAKTVVLFNESDGSPSILDSSRGWTSIAVVEWALTERTPVIEESIRRWRIRSRYEHQGSGGPATVQIRILTPDGPSLFTHPWSQNAERYAEAYSNWFEDPKHVMDSGERSIVEARLIAPPRTPLTGSLYALSIEAWDLLPKTVQPSTETSSVHLAYSRTAPKIPAPSIINPDVNPPGEERALALALQFVEHCITGDLSAYYRSQADTIYSLDDGSVLQKYRLSLPANIPGVSTLKDYKNRFEYHIYNQSIYSEMFPEWFQESREWIPDNNSYLFMGHIDKYNTENLDDIDFLVFIVGFDEKGQLKVIARPE